MWVPGRSESQSLAAARLQELLDCLQHLHLYLTSPARWKTFNTNAMATEFSGDADMSSGSVAVVAAYAAGIWTFFILAVQTIGITQL